MAGKIHIEKINATTIVSTYDSATPALKNIRNFNKRTNITFDSRNNHAIIDCGTVSNPIFITIQNLEGDFTATNMEELAEEFADKGLFTGTVEPLP